MPVWGDVGNLGLYALVFCKGIGIVCEDVCNRPDGGKLAGCHGITDGRVGVGRALLDWICRTRSVREERGRIYGPVIRASSCSVARSGAGADADSKGRVAAMTRAVRRELRSDSRCILTEKKRQ